MEIKIKYFPKPIFVLLLLNDAIFLNYTYNVDHVDILCCCVNKTNFCSWSLERFKGACISFYASLYQ